MLLLFWIKRVSSKEVSRGFEGDSNSARCGQLRANFQIETQISTSES